MHGHHPSRRRPHSSSEAGVYTWHHWSVRVGCQVSSYERVRFTAVNLLGSSTVVNARSEVYPSNSNPFLSLSPRFVLSMRCRLPCVYTRFAAAGGADETFLTVAFRATFLSALCSGVTSFACVTFCWLHCLASGTLFGVFALTTCKTFFFFPFAIPCSAICRRRTSEVYRDFSAFYIFEERPAGRK